MRIFILLLFVTCKVFAGGLLDKARQDFYFKHLLKKLPEGKEVKVLERAGFFDDELDFSLQKKILSGSEIPGENISFNKLDFKAISDINNKRLAVLLSTGSYAPIHLGHLKILQTAKHILETKNDYKVVGAYLSPSHDKYVLTKGPKLRGFNFKTRCGLIRKSLEGEFSFIDVSTWEGSLEWSINYTDVIFYLKETLNKNFKNILRGRVIEVFYVVGGDRTEFARAFLIEGKIVVVPRGDKYLNIVNNLKGDPMIKGNKNIIFAEEIESIKDVSSTSIRAKERLAASLPAQIVADVKNILDS